jgi:hypothetical protein
MLEKFATLTVLGAFVFTAGACDLLQPKIDNTKAEALVRSILEKEQIKIDSVQCPADQPATKGHKFECVATCAVGTEVHFSLEVMDDSGTVLAQPRSHTVAVKSVEQEIADDLAKLGHTVQSIDCHGEVWVSVPGAIATCDIVDEAGTKYVWTAEFKDDKGGHTHKIEPA